MVRVVVVAEMLNRMKVQWQWSGMSPTVSASILPVANVVTDSYENYQIPDVRLGVYAYCEASTGTLSCGIL